MTRYLPEEILYTIFDNIGLSDLLICQQVCRYWYSLARVKLLKDVKLTSHRAIDQFIASFEHNSHKSYFNAVKKIQIWRKGGMWSPKMTLERTTLEKLLLPFPSLKEVVFDHTNLVENFDEELCKELLSHCPKLNKFDVMTHYAEPEYCDFLLKVKPLLTNVILFDDKHLHNADDAVRFITQFPRLQSLTCHEVINSLDLFLPIMEQLNVVFVDLGIDNDLEENFEEKFLTANSQDLMVKRLSNITYLILNTNCDIVNTLKFVAQYFTGLKKFTMEYEDLSAGVTGTQHDLLCRNTFDVLPSIKNDFRITIYDLYFTSLSKSFPSLMQNMFQKPPSAHRQSNLRLLELIVANQSFKFDTLQLDLDSTNSSKTRTITLEVDPRFKIDKIALHLFGKDVPMDQVDVFKLSYRDKYYPDLLSIYAEEYLKLLEKMPSVSIVELDVPTSFVETELQDFKPYTGPVLNQVKSAILSGTSFESMQSLLNGLCFLFPNLNSLHIENHCGICWAHMGEFLLNLQDYSLQKLTVDVNPLVVMLNRNKLKFFVLKVANLDSTKQCFYKISHDLSSSKVIRKSDLKGLRCREDYLRVCLTIDSLKQVVLRNGAGNTRSCVIKLKEWD